MNKYSFVYSIVEEFIDIDDETKNKIKQFKLTKDKNIPEMNLNNFWNIKEKEKLKKLVNIKFKNILKKYNLTLRECWLQKYLKNSYHNLHTHSLDKKSFVWFIEGNKSSSPLYFYDVGYPVINTEQTIKFNFVPGTLLIFPGFLPHEVRPCKNNNRLVISGNVF